MVATGGAYFPKTVGDTSSSLGVYKEALSWCSFWMQALSELTLKAVGDESP